MVVDQMSRGDYYRFSGGKFFCCRYLRLHFLQQVPSTCTGSESSEQLVGGQKILRHSTTPFCKKILFYYLFYQNSNAHCEHTVFACVTAKGSTLSTVSYLAQFTFGQTSVVILYLVHLIYVEKTTPVPQQL